MTTFTIRMNNNTNGNLPLWTIFVLRRPLDTYVYVFWIYSTQSCAYIFSEYRDYFRGLKRPEREVHNSYPSSAGDKNQWSYTSNLHICVHDENMTKRNFTFYCVLIYMHLYFHHVRIYRVSQEDCARLRKSVPYIKVYRYNPKHLYPKLNGYGDNGQRILKL